MKVLLIIVICLSSGLGISAQKFEASVVVGMNAAQIDGDLLYGYNKPGIQAGISIYYPYRENLKFSLEMLYCQRGSQDGFAFGGEDDDRLRTSLNYASLPLISNFMLLKDEGLGKYKIKLSPGLAYSYLIEGKSPGGGVNDNENFRNHDLSFLAGISYMMVNNVWIGFRYTRSVVGAIDIPSRAETALISYFLNFRLEINL
ncbi:MAG: outer membrane beta-barrel protein [Saprospiraceae bacterium]|nr:outer membrane beta-barrel protein [Saprospiraceae bacterium]